ncbi:hypothetical protein [Phnomibacter sp. MR]|uniref:hypothetical protein n=1 Tax=Phnomibacter sp. MR TaxID=3042318 RepID=UPI003A7F8A1A
MNVETIVKRHPQSVAFSFSQFGYGHLPVNLETVTAMTQKYGEAFAASVATAIEQGNEFTFLSNAFNPQKMQATLRNNSTVKPGKSVVKRSLTKLTGSPAVVALKVPSAEALTEVPDGLRMPTVTTAAVPAVQAKKSNLWNNIKDGLMLAAGIYATATGKPNTTTPNSVVLQAQSPAKHKTNSWLIVGIAVIVVLAIVLIVKQAKK